MEMDNGHNLRGTDLVQFISISSHIFEWFNRSASTRLIVSLALLLPKRE